MSEEMLIRYCAPTLAGIKTASLFTCPSDSKEELREQIRSANRQLLPRGIRLLPLRQQSGHALIYMYRPKRLERDLASQKAEAILRSGGLQSCRCACVNSMNSPMRLACFSVIPRMMSKVLSRTGRRHSSAPVTGKCMEMRKKRKHSSTQFPSVQLVIAGVIYTE